MKVAPVKKVQMWQGRLNSLKNFNFYEISTKKRLFRRQCLSLVFLMLQVVLGPHPDLAL